MIFPLKINGKKSKDWENLSTRYWELERYWIDLIMLTYGTSSLKNKSV